VQLRDYQSRAIERAREAYRQGARSVCLVSPTGSGKTVIASELARSAVARGGRVLWVAHRAELLRQAQSKLSMFGVPAGIVAPWAKSEPNIPVQVASVDTLVARGSLPPATVVIWDECHHVAASGWHTIAEHYRTSTILGLTATPSRGDGRALDDVFGALVVVAQPRELIEAGHLVPTHVFAPETKRKQLALDPLDAYQQRTPGTQTLVFCPNVAYANDLAMRFSGAGVEAACVDGGCSAEVRAAALDAFADKRLRVLTNVYVLTEGYDCPGIETVILARGASTPGIYLQMVGRGLRPAPGKSHVTVIDLVGCVHEHGLPDEDREYSLSGKAIRRGTKSALGTRTCKQCGAIQRTGGLVCVRCGAPWPPPPPPVVRATDLALVSRRARQTDDTKKQRFLDFLYIAKKRGYRRGWAFHRYYSLYGEKPEWKWSHG